MTQQIEVVFPNGTKRQALLVDVAPQVGAVIFSNSVSETQHFSAIYPRTTSTPEPCR